MHVAGSGRRGRKKGLNFELNLIPFIDVLSTCICFLLVTAVFINLGSFHVSQAVGSAAADKDKPKGSVTVSFNGQGEVRLDVKDVPNFPRAQSTYTITGEEGRVNTKRLEGWIRGFAAQYAEVKTVLLMPSPSSKYDDLVQVMAQFKKASMDQVGIAPL